MGTGAATVKTSPSIPEQLVGHTVLVIGPEGQWFEAVVMRTQPPCPDGTQAVRLLTAGERSSTG